MPIQVRTRTTSAEKTSFSRSVRWPAVRRANPMPEIERLRRRCRIHRHPATYGRLWTFPDQAPNAEPEQIFSSRCHTEQAASFAGRKLFFFNDDRSTHKAGQNRTALPSSGSKAGWWSRTGSNRRPPACKAGGALPAELRPLFALRAEMVGLDRLELSTSPLSGVRSNHLSYRPGSVVGNQANLSPDTALSP